MASTIDTSDGKIVLNGGAVTLPSSAVSVSSPANGSFRYNTVGDNLELYSASGAWYSVGAMSLKGSEILATDTTLTQAEIGQLVICNDSSTITVTLPAISGLKQLTGFVFDTRLSFMTLHTSGSDMIYGASSHTFPKGAHISVVCAGTEWIVICDHNPYATVTPFVFESVSYGASAAGTNQGTATAIAAKFNVITTVASGTGVRLPTFVNIGIGAELVIWNQGVNALAIYPQTGGTIDALSMNAAHSLAAGNKIRLVAVTSTLWLSLAA